MLRREFLLLSTLAGVVGCGIDLAKSMGPTEKQFNSVQQGMTEKQVVDILGAPSKRMAVQGGEGGVDRLVIYRWISSNHIITVTFDGTGTTVGKQRI